MLGSVSDMVVHYCARPVVVIPHPMLADEYAALSDGPALVGWDGSAGAATAFAAARRLFPERDFLLVSVDEGATAAPPADTSGPAGQEVLRLNVEAGHGFHARAISDGLIAAARDREAAVMVVGSRGHSAAQEILLGSVALATLHHSHRPVMIVPSEWEIPSEP